MECEKAYKVLCIDPGYPLWKTLKMFRKGDFPGHLLYGVNHMSDYGIETMFVKAPGGERTAYEISVLKEVGRIKPDAVYLTFSDHGFLFLLINMVKRKLNLHSLAVVGLFHGYHEEVNKNNGKEKLKVFARNIMRTLQVVCVDKAIFISEYAYNQYRNGYSKRFGKTFYIPLQPEMIDLEDMQKDRFHLLSVGKTKREYYPLTECLRTKGGIRGTIITNNMVDRQKGAENLEIISDFLSFKDVLPYYKQAGIIVVPVEESGGGVYGLSSILDAMAVKTPILASKTVGIGVDIDGLNLGRTYSCNDAESFCMALEDIMENYASIEKSISKYVQEHNIHSFAEAVSEIIRESIEELANNARKSSSNPG